MIDVRPTEGSKAGDIISDCSIKCIITRKVPTHRYQFSFLSSIHSVTLKEFFSSAGLIITSAILSSVHLGGVLFPLSLQQKGPQHPKLL